MADRFSDRHLAQVTRDRDRANVVLAHIVESLGASEDTAWEHLPEVVRALRDRADALEAERSQLAGPDLCVACGTALDQLRVAAERGVEPPGEVRPPITPEECGSAHYGVHLFSHEDDWGWTAYGHPETRRLVAAISAEARENGGRDELCDYVGALPDLIAGVERKWATNFRSGPSFDIEWDWCDEGTPGAVPMTQVIP